MEHVYVNSGIYNVSLATSNNELCFSDTTINQAIIVLQKANANFSIEPNEIFVNDPVINLTNLSSFSNSYMIDLGDGLIVNEFINQHIYTSNFTTEFITVTLTANNDNNCPDTITKNIEIIYVSEIYVPNAFTPNNDGLNDTWGPEIIGNLKYYELLVFNRWGEQIFKSNNKDYKWNGWYKENPVQNDVYVYRLVVQFDENEKKLHKIGKVTVLR